MKRSLPFFLALVLSATAFAVPPEVRGTWLSTNDSDALATPVKTAESMRRLREIGLNTVYVECYRNGYTTFPTDMLQKTIGVTHKINLPDQPQVAQKTRDLLAESIIEAHRNGLLHLAWFESGFAAGTQEDHDGLAQKKPQWLLRDKAGSEVAPDGLVWMNPANPEVRAFVIGIVIEAVTRYDLDGIHFDEHLAWPDATMGRDEFTRHAYMTDNGGSPIPDDPADPNWEKWRTAKVREFIEQLVAAVRKVRPDILISISPAGGDEVVAIDWQKPFETVGDRKKDLVALLTIVGKDAATTPWDELEHQIGLVRKSEVGGHALWPGRGVLQVYSAHLAQFYDVSNTGFVPHPKRPADWRPPPVAGVKRGGHWHLRVSQPGTYSVIIRKAGVWIETTRRRSAGNSTVDIRDQKYEAVEMVLDRRSR